MKVDAMSQTESSPGQRPQTDTGPVKSLRTLPSKARNAMGYVLRRDFKGLCRRLLHSGQASTRLARSNSYQTFPGTLGASDSFGKLKALRLPPLAGKSFLDVGCNEGFFCGFARFQGAARSVGLDREPKFIAAARSRFPDCEFLLQSWESLPEERFDVVLLASSLHYADDQPELIRRLVDRLNPRGVLVLELGVAPGDKEEWVTVSRSIDERPFPTRRKLAEILKEYAWKDIGPSVAQAGDPIPRRVVHVSKRSPIAYLLMQPPAHGKTTIAAALFEKSGIPVVSGDALLSRISAGMVEATPALKRILGNDFSVFKIDLSVHALFAAGIASDYVDAWLTNTGGSDFAFEGFIPPEHHEQVTSLLKDKGYLPVRLEWDRLGDGPASAARADETAALYKAFISSK